MGENDAEANDVDEKGAADKAVDETDVGEKEGDGNGEVKIRGLCCPGHVV